MNKDFKEKINWKFKKTKNGYNARVLFSVINKELRRGKTDNSIIVAKELYDSGSEFQNKLWQRLITVTAEDIGLGNIGLYIHVCNAYNTFAKTCDFRIIHECIEQICKSSKNRYADEVLNYCLLKYIASDLEYFSVNNKKALISNMTEKQLSKALKNKNLVKAAGAFICLCFSGKKYEVRAWDTLRNNICKWKEHIDLACTISMKMKLRKNDRIIAGVLFITAYMMQIKINKIKSIKHLKNVSLNSKIEIPSYAMDLHANINNRKLNTSDFKTFWLESSKLNNEKYLGNNKYYSPKYKKFILDNLDIFLQLYYFRKRQFNN